MSMLKVACEDQRLYLVESTTIASGGVNETRVLFNFCPLWDGYAKTAVFYRNMREPYYAIVNDDNIALIPWEVVKDPGFMYFGVFGIKEGVNRTSEVLTVRIVPGAITAEIAPADPTPDIYIQILSDYSTIKERMVAVDQSTAASAASAKESADRAVEAETQVVNFVDEIPTQIKNAKTEIDEFTDSQITEIDEFTEECKNEIETLINSGVIADNTVTTEKIADGAVTTEKLADGSVTASKVGSDVATLDSVGKVKAEQASATVKRIYDNTEYTLTADDMGKMVIFQMSSGTTNVTFPADSGMTLFPLGSEVEISKWNGGLTVNISVQDSVNIRAKNENTLKTVTIDGKYGVIAFKRIADTIWYAVGDIA